MKEQFKENLSLILENKNVGGVTLRNVNLLKEILNDKPLFDEMYKQFENNFIINCDENDLYTKSEDYMYRLNMLVNDCLIPNYDLNEIENIKRRISELVYQEIDLYSAVSYDATDESILEEFYGMCKEMGRDI